MKQVAMLLGVLLVAGCAQERYVLLPDESGQRGSLLVKAREKSPVTLDSPYSLATSGVWGIGKRTAEGQEVKDIWRDSLDAHPMPPKKFTLYFLEGSDELTPESEKELEGVFGEIHKRKVVDIVVIGHTDTVGSLASNDRLAETRATTMKAELVRRGIDPSSIKTIGRGERELKVETPDEVTEPLNRRVEIQVR